jgi:hypothetical protein
MQNRPDPLDAAAAFVAREFPHARAAFVGGSVLTEHRTPTSDLDVVVVVGDGATASPPAPGAPFRETFWHDGWVVEAFVHTRESLDDFWERDAARRVCSLLRMCSDSEVVADPEGLAADIQREARRRLEEGPPEPAAADVEARRYALSDLLEDLAGADREDELAFIAGLVLARTAELALLPGGHWEGSGKALARQLRSADPDLAERLVDAHRLVLTEGDTAPLYRCALQVLETVGGPLLVGYRLVAGGGR